MILVDNASIDAAGERIGPLMTPCRAGLARAADLRAVGATATSALLAASNISFGASRITSLTTRGSNRF